MSGHSSRQSSLARQFAGSAAALAAVAVLLIAAGSWWWIDRLHQESARTLAQRDVELRAAQVADTLVLIDERLREVAASPLLQTALTDSFGREAYLLPYLGSIQTINAVPVELLLVDFQGRELGRNGDVTIDAGERAQLLQMLREGRSGAVLLPGTDGDDMLFAVMVEYRRTGTVEGALWARLPAKRLLRDGGYLLLTGRAARQEALPAGADTSGGRKSANADTRSRIALPPALDSLDLAVQREKPVATVSNGRTTSSLAVAATALLLMLVVAWVGQRLARRLTADLRELQQFASTVAARSFGNERAPETGAAEVASLARSLNRMLDQLNQQHDTLQDAARQQLHLLGTCIANLNDVVMITEAEAHGKEGHRIVFVNEAFTRLTGYTREEVIGKDPRLLQGALTERAEIDRIAAALRNWQPVRAELVNYRKDGSRFWVELEILPVKDASGRVTHWVSVERDVTERREAADTQAALEAQVREAQKAEAIGTLAAGIAHDFNNILAAVLGNLALARQELAQGRPATDRLAQIERSASRARGLVEQILSYSRRQDGTLHRVPQDLKGLLAETVSLLRATVPARVQLNSQMCEQPVVVIGDGVALEQVLMNLGTNAWQALQGSTGDVTFGIDTVEIAAGAVPTLTAMATRRGGPALPTLLQFPQLPQLTTGPYAWLWVADDGCGMDAATQARVFEPFFTTKAVGAGTGLGLSVVQGIVRAHGGAIALCSTPGSGTVFHVVLPLSTVTPLPSAAAVPVAAVSTGQGQQVLYVDDDDVMVAVAAGLLEHWGYRVTALRSATEALAAVRADPQRYSLVITDYNMPELSGMELLTALRQLRVDLPVVLTSGYVAEDTRAEALAAGAYAVLRKENLQDELAAMAAQALQPG